jgi:hypothetical protein
LSIGQVFRQLEVDVLLSMHDCQHAPIAPVHSGTAAVQSRSQAQS